jgi:hypothetical protein
MTTTAKRQTRPHCIKMMDALHFHMDLIRDLRQNCWCPDTDCDGTLYYKGHDGKPVKVIDLNEVP